MNLRYNLISKNQCSTQPLKGCFVLPSVYAIRPSFRVSVRLFARLMTCCAVFGGVGKEQSPRCHWQLEHPRLLLAVFNLKTSGGHHA